jgi:hypothetical protein
MSMELGQADQRLAGCEREWLAAPALDPQNSSLFTSGGRRVRRTVLRIDSEMTKALIGANVLCSATAREGGVYSCEDPTRKKSLFFHSESWPAWA